MPLIPIVREDGTLEPIMEVDDCPCCGGPIYSCLTCGFETTNDDKADDHECGPAQPIEEELAP